MQPILFTVAGFHFYSLSFFIVLAWFVFSFLFWRSLRNQAVSDERIFDLTFYATLIVFIGARLVYVILHQELFHDSLLKIPALWVQPGLSLYGGLVTGLLTILYLARRYKVRVAYVLDSLAFSLPLSLCIGLIGSLLDGTTIGILTEQPWGIFYAGHAGRRHPVQIYDGLILVLIYIIVHVVHKRANKLSLPYGTTGLWFFLLFSVSMFIVEFLKDGSVYFSYLTVNQWIHIAFFAETLGAFYVRGGGRERIRPVVVKSRESIASSIRIIYEKFSKRRP